MSVLKGELCRKLAAHASANVSDLRGRSFGVAADWEDKVDPPGLRVIPRGAFKLEIFGGEEEITEPSDSTLLVSVGVITGALQARLYGHDNYEREDLDDEVLALFLATEGFPGSLTLQSAPVSIGGTATLYRAPLTYRLDGEEWNEEQVWGKTRYSFLSLDVEYPLLVMRREVYALSGADGLGGLQLWLSTDLCGPEPEYEVIRPLDGGTFERLP